MMTPGGLVEVGRSGRGRKRFDELNAIRRILPACTMALDAAIELISAGMRPLATSPAICAAERYGTSTRPRPARLLKAARRQGAAPAVTSTA